MKTKKQTPPPTGRSTTIAGAGAKPGPVTIGFDLGDKKHAICVLDAAGTVLKKETIANDRPALTQFSNLWPEALIIMEAGTHSPWISRFFKELGHRVIVANPRKVRAIYQSERKSDDRDAELLARIARVDEALLHPVEHGDEKQQRDMLAIKLRDALTRARVSLINAAQYIMGPLRPARSPARTQRKARRPHAQPVEIRSRLTNPAPLSPHPRQPPPDNRLPAQPAKPTPFPTNHSQPFLDRISKTPGQDEAA